MVKVTEFSRQYYENYSFCERETIISLVSWKVLYYTELADLLLLPVGRHVYRVVIRNGTEYYKYMYLTFCITITGEVILMPRPFNSSFLVQNLFLVIDIIFCPTTVFTCCHGNFQQQQPAYTGKGYPEFCTCSLI